MRRILILELIFLALGLARTGAITTPSGLVSRSGDQSIVLLWDRPPDAAVAGYRIYRALTNGGPFSLLNSTGLVTTLGYCDLSTGVMNGRTNYYQVTAVSSGAQESLPTPALAV